MPRSVSTPSMRIDAVAVATVIRVPGAIVSQLPSCTTTRALSVASPGPHVVLVAMTMTPLGGAVSEKFMSGGGVHRGAYAA